MRPDPVSPVALLYLGQLLEYGGTVDMFTKPQLTETQDYVTGRFG